MSTHSPNQVRGRRAGFVLGGVLLLVATYLPWLPRLSQESDELGPAGRWSYDALHALLPEKNCPEVQLIEQDQKSYTALRQDPDRTWDRRWHADLLRRLTRDGARLVVFD